MEIFNTLIQWVQSIDLREMISQWGYIVLFLYSFGGGFVALVFAGVLSYTGDLNIIITIFVAGCSNFLGDQFLFFLARNNKNYAKEMMNKFGRKVAFTHLLMRRYGWIVIFIQKYIYGIKTLIPLAMGLTKYDAKQFLVFNGIAAFLWAGIIGLLSYYLGEALLYFTEHYKLYGIAFIVMIIGLFIYYMRRI